MTCQTCDSCEPGRASEKGHSVCTNCISGSFAFSPGSTRCELCQRGRTSVVSLEDATGASVCSECEPGYFYDAVRARTRFARLTCPKGVCFVYLRCIGVQKGGTACFECSAGYFASGRAASACHGTCSPGYFALAAASKCDACSVCPPNCSTLAFAGKLCSFSMFQ